MTRRHGPNHPLPLVPDEAEATRSRCNGLKASGVRYTNATGRPLVGELP
jgi:hypothetical protein